MLGNVHWNDRKETGWGLLQTGGRPGLAEEATSKLRSEEWDKLAKAKSQRVPGGGNSKYESPGAGMCLEHLTNNEEASAAGRARGRKETRSEKRGRWVTGEKRSRRVFQATERNSGFLLSAMRSDSDGVEQ